MVAAFIYGGRAIRVLATVLLLTGILQLMMPTSPLVVFGSGFLLCLYVAVVSLDLLIRWRPSTILVRETIALLATWWALIIPVGLMYAVGVFYSFGEATFNFSLFTLQGNWAIAYLAAMICGPLLLIRRARLREMRTGSIMEG